MYGAISNASCTPRDGEGIVQRTNACSCRVSGAERRSVKKIRRFTAYRFEPGPRDHFLL